MAKRAAIYLRISTDRTGERAGVERQREDCEVLIERRKWEISDVYVDNDVSASSGKRRPEYERLLSDIRAGHVDVVVAWHPDRLHRRPVELEDFIGLLETTGATVATVQSGELDLATPSGRMVARMLGSAARYEVELKGERQRRKHEQLARAGRPAGGGDRPFGYEEDRITVRKGEARLIRAAAKRLVAGATVRGILRQWSDAGIKTPRGGPWRPQSFRRMILSARIAGLRELRGALIGKAIWAPIIDELTHERLRGIFTDPVRQKFNPGTARRYLLTGFTYCAACGTKMVARPRDDGRRRYVCAKGPGNTGCGKTFTLAEPLEELVVGAVFVALDSEAFTEALREARTNGEGHEVDALASIRADEKALERLAVDYYSEGLLGRPEYLAARTVVQDRIEAARKTLAGSTRVDVRDEALDGMRALRKRWPDGDLDTRRGILGAVLERVAIGPAVRGRNTFDPTRVSFVWAA